MQVYLDQLKEIRDVGKLRENRTGVNTLGLFGRMLKFDLRQGFPLLTTKKLHFRSIAYELLWFLRGDTNVKFLQDNGVTIWDEWADEDGELGPVYGHQWINWLAPDGSTINQIQRLEHSLRTNPASRRHIVTAWNPADVDSMALPPCHYSMQFYVADSELSCLFQMRSLDYFLGAPFNIASYALLTHMLAHSQGLGVGEMTMSVGDIHIYVNHLEQSALQLTRQPKALPRLEWLVEPKPSVFDYKYEDFKIVDYVAEPNIKAPIAK